jgi:hypothetical protein
MAKAIDPIPHPTIDWSRATRMGRETHVPVVCPVCQKERWLAAGSLSTLIRKGQFTGRCYKDRYLGKPHRRTGARPLHPAVDWQDIQLLPFGNQGHRMSHVAVHCPKCCKKRYLQMGSVHRDIEHNKFTGLCKPCCPSAHKRIWIELSPGRRVDPVKGYVRLCRYAVAEEDLPLFDALRGKRTTVLEHRLVMAKRLNRSLSSNELVDHQDGNKQNNHPENLRIYVRGKNMPGDTCGYGTFYHEWQLALTQIRDLEERLALVSSVCNTGSQSR